MLSLNANCICGKTLQEAEETVQEMLSKVQSDPYLKAAAARGVIRGPQLAQVELELRKLISAYGGTKADSTRFTGQQKEQLPQEAMEPDGQADTAKGSHVGHNGQHKAEQQRAVVGSDRQGNSRSLAQAVFGYYKQLGHMLSCAVDLRSAQALHNSCIFASATSRAYAVLGSGIQG